MVYKVIERQAIPMRDSVKSDETIELTSEHARERCPSHLRRVVVWDAERERELVFLTNVFHLAASTIGAIYKDRWQIELFFKALKQNLKIKTFVGTSENAVNVQIWTALIAMLLLKFLLLKSTWAWSLSNLAAMLRFNLLSYRDLWAWLNAPFEIPIVVAHGEQMTLLE
jgi:Transposase DDE domain